MALGLAVLMAAWSRACAGNTCPSIEELGGYDPDQASKVYAADGRLITDLGLAGSPEAALEAAVAALREKTEPVSIPDEHVEAIERALASSRAGLSRKITPADWEDIRQAARDAAAGKPLSNG